MPKVYENKADHNQDFLDSVQNDYPDNFFDWKVTIQFYTALHRCYCVAKSNGNSIEKSHKDNIDCIKSIDSELGQKLFLVYKYSRQARYEGFMSEESMNRINKINFQRGVGFLRRINEIVATHYPVAV